MNSDQNVRNNANAMNKQTHVDTQVEETNQVESTNDKEIANDLENINDNNGREEIKGNDIETQDEKTGTAESISKVMEKKNSKNLNEKLPCILCKKLFNRQRNLDQHMVIVHESKTQRKIKLTTAENID